MHVFAPDATTKIWDLDAALVSNTFAAPTTPFTVTRTGRTTTSPDCVTLAIWATPDDCSWTSLSGTGWVVTGTAQYRNTSSTDQSLSFAHHLDAAAGAVPNVSKNQTTVTGAAGLTAIITFYAYADTVDLANGLQGYWKMDEASAGNRADSSGNSRTANQTGTVPSVSGKYTNACDFNSISNYLSVAHASALNGAQDFTIAFWVYLDVDIPHNILVKGTSGGTKEYAFQYAGATINFINNGTTVGWGSSFAMSTWYHVLVTYRHATGAIAMYVNNGTPATGTGIGTTTTDPLLIGNDGVNSMDGRLCELCFWNRRLGPSERAAVAVASIVFADLKSNLTTFYELDEASGARNDSVGVAHLGDFNTVLSAAGLVGTAADFEKDNAEYLWVTSSEALLTGDISLSVQALVKLESKTGVNQFLVSKWNSSNYEYVLFYDSAADRFAFGVSSNGGGGGFSYVAANNLGAVSTGVWYLIHGWHDAVNNQIGIAVNAGTADTASHSGGLFNGTSGLTLGRNEDIASEWLDGLAQQVGIWKGRVLSSADRTALWAGGAILPYPFTGGGGAALTLSLSDGLSLGDSRIGSAGFARNLPDALAMGEALARLMTFRRSLADAMALGENVAKVRALARSCVDAISMGENVTKSSAIARALVDAMSLGEVIALARVLRRSMTDPLSLGETILRNATFRRTQQDALSLGESLSKVFGRALSDPLSIGENVIKARSLARALTDALGLGENLIKAVGIARTLTDPLVLGENITKIVLLSRSLTDAIGLLESVRKMISRPLADAIVLGENVIKVRSLVRSYVDAIALGENLTKSLTIARSLVDAMSLSDVVAAALVLTRTISDSLTINEIVFRSAVFARIRQDALSLGEAISRVIVYARSFADPLVLGDVLSRTADYKRVTGDVIALMDSVTMFFVIARELSDAIALTESIVKTGNFLRSLDDSLHLDEVIELIKIGEPSFKTAWARGPYNIGTGGTPCR